LTTNNLEDKDYCLSCGAGAEKLLDDDDNFALVMKNMKPACMGDESMDLRFLGIGLKGDGKAECTICRDLLKEKEEAASKSILVTLPCMHVFHKQCIVGWLGSDLGRPNWNCPSCRSVMPYNMTRTYTVDYDKQTQTRINEYPLSGFCTKCMIWTMERNRNVHIGVEGDDGVLHTGAVGIRAERQDNTFGRVMGYSSRYP
jgi:hypothetical protein